MASTAKVHSFEAIKRFRSALIIFAEEAAGSLGSLNQEIIRLMEWLKSDQPAYWKKQVQNGFNAVAQARTALARAKLKTIGGKTPSCIEEKKALQKAKHALAHAQRQIEVVRHWGVKIQQESDEFRGRLGRLDMMVNLEIPKMLALLENMINALESYVAIQAVETAPVASPEARTTTSPTATAGSPNPGSPGTAPAVVHSQPTKPTSPQPAATQPVNQTSENPDKNLSRENDNNSDNNKVQP